MFVFFPLFILLEYSGTSNSGHFRGPNPVAVALEVTVVGIFYNMYTFY